MLKKVLIAVGILAVVGVIVVGVAGYGIFSTVQTKFEEHKPELRQYITMTVDEQNAYVEKNLDYILDAVVKDATDDKQKQLYEKIKAAPDAKAAGIELGRAILATAILSSDELTENLKDEVKSKFEKESESLNTRLDKYKSILENYGAK